jgi:hypothetical protein
MTHNINNDLNSIIKEEAPLCGQFDPENQVKSGEVAQPNSLKKNVPDEPSGAPGASSGKTYASAPLKASADAPPATNDLKGETKAKTTPTAQIPAQSASMKQSEAGKMPAEKKSGNAKAPLKESGASAPATVGVNGDTKAKTAPAARRAALKRPAEEIIQLERKTNGPGGNAKDGVVPKNENVKAITPGKEPAALPGVIKIVNSETKAKTVPPAKTTSRHRPEAVKIAVKKKKKSAKASVEGPLAISAAMDGVKSEAGAKNRPTAKTPYQWRPTLEKTSAEKKKGNSKAPLKTSDNSQPAMDGVKSKTEVKTSPADAISSRQPSPRENTASEKKTGDALGSVEGAKKAIIESANYEYLVNASSTAPATNEVKGEATAEPVSAALISSRRRSAADISAETATEGADGSSKGGETSEKDTKSPKARAIASVTLPRPTESGKRETAPDTASASRISSGHEISSERKPSENLTKVKEGRGKNGEDGEKKFGNSDNPVKTTAGKPAPRDKAKGETAAKSSDAFKSAPSEHTKDKARSEIMTGEAGGSDNRGETSKEKEKIVKVSIEASSASSNEAVNSKALAEEEAPLIKEPFHLAAKWKTGNSSEAEEKCVSYDIYRNLKIEERVEDNNKSDADLLGNIAFVGRLRHVYKHFAKSLTQTLILLIILAFCVSGTAKFVFFPADDASYTPARKSMKIAIDSDSTETIVDTQRILNWASETVWGLSAI